MALAVFATLGVGHFFHGAPLEKIIMTFRASMKFLSVVLKNLQEANLNSRVSGVK